MKTTALAAVALLSFMWPAEAKDFSGVPTDIAAKIKSQCVSKYPEDYMMQAGCISLQSNSYLDVHGAQSELDVSGSPTAFDQSQINNSAYLRVARSHCNLDVGEMPQAYLVRALESGGLNRKQAVAAAAQGAAKLASRIGDKQTFCAEAERKLPRFRADLAPQ